ncbi:MAG: DMT family transporter [Acidobacteriota bacterium]
MKGQDGTPPSPPRRATPWGAYGILVVVFIIWANSFVAARVLVGDGVPEAERLSALQFVLVRFAPVALWGLAFFAARCSARVEAKRLLLSHWGLLLMLAAANVWGYNLAFGEGHHRVSAGTGALIIVLNPVFTFLLSVLLGFERVLATRIAGLSVAFAGIWVVVVYGAGRAVEPAYFQDAAILVLAPVCWALYTVFGKPLLEQTSPMVLTFLVLAIGSLPTLPWLALDTDLHQRLAAWGWERWSAALFLSVGCTILAFWLWFVALKQMEASSAAAFVFLNPPLAVLFEWLWLGRRPEIALLAGGVLVLLGVWLCNRSPG